MKSEKWVSEHVWNLMTLRKKKYIMLIIIVLAVGLFIGYSFGTYNTIKAVANIASGFISPPLLKQAIWQWENNVCFRESFPSQILNASNNWNQGE